MKIILTFAFLLMTVPTLAKGKGGTTVGGGGSGVECASGSVEVLDLYELRRTQPFETVGEGISLHKEIAFMDLPAMMTERLREAGADVQQLAGPLSTLRALSQDALYSLQIFATLTSWTAPYGTTGDEGSLLTPVDPTCRLVQIGVYNDALSPTPLAINRLYFDRLSSVDASAFLVHEAFHAYFKNEPDTQSIRSVVRILFSSKMSRSLQRAELVKRLKLSRAQ